MLLVRLTVAVGLLVCVSTTIVRACPFCSAVSLTFSEEIKQADAAVIARLVERGKVPEDPLASVVPGESDSTFAVVDVLKGKKALAGGKVFKTFYVGKDPIGTKFLVMASEPADLRWTTPIKLSDRAIEYVKTTVKLPEKGADRLDFYQKYLNDKDSLLAQDAYDEFAKADYSVVQQLKDRMDRKQLLAWIQDTEIPASRRRLFLTMLGVCGKKEDVAVLEGMLKSDDAKVKAGLDALIASYLTLKGPDGMKLVEELFISNAKAPFTETYKAIMALRFLGEDQTAVSRKRVLQALRLMLERPKYADLVIPDLARWEDWQATPQLVQLFKDATKENSWVRVPVLRFLQASPKPEAKAYIEELSKIDPSAARRAASFFPLPGAKPPEKKDAAGSDAPATDSTPKTTSQTTAPTAVAHGDVNHQANKPLVADGSSRRDHAGMLSPPSGERDADASPIEPMHLYLAFVAGATALGIMMWSLLYGSARYEKIAAHGVRRK